MVAMQDIQRYCDAIAAVFKPQRIILFGSHAYGKPHPDSDVDVMVVMPKSRRMGQRPSLKIRETIKAGFPVDILVRDPEDVARRIADRESFILDVTEKGRVMYEASHA